MISKNKIISLLQKNNLIISSMEYENLLNIEEFRYSEIIQFFIKNRRFIVAQRKFDGEWIFYDFVNYKNNKTIKSINQFQEIINKKLKMRKYEKILH